MNDSQRKIDHADVTTEYTQDPATNPHGEENQQKTANTRVTPAFILAEFHWQLKAGLAITPENQVVDSNWSLKPNDETVKTVTAGCIPMFNARVEDIKTKSEAFEMEERFYAALKETLDVLLLENSWLGYGFALGVIAQGAKEVASAVRFAIRAADWQERLDADNDTETMGPTNMIESAFEQSARGTALICAMQRAYDVQVTDPKAARLIVNDQTFRSATYTALNIEANKHRKTYDHPGKAAQRGNASAGAARAHFAAVMGLPATESESS